MTSSIHPGEIIDATVYANAIERLRDANVLLPTFSELADAPDRLGNMSPVLDGVGPDEARAENLFRVHWFNQSNRRDMAGVPGYIVLGQELTGVASPIVVLLGERFPMIGAHKVLAAYACLATRLVSGQFDPVAHRAIWPSTGNYCRGGVAISRILGCRGVAVLPEGMSKERFSWLEDWVTEKSDIIRTHGSESNVKEIYDKCAELSEDSSNVILNQFSEFANYLIHFHCTGRALERVVGDVRKADEGLGVAAFVAGTGSGGTLAAGDYLKNVFGARVVAVEPTECPTMLYNGYGEHNIQGIGDKHIPLIQNVMNTDMVVGVSDASCDRLNVLFNTDVGRQYLTGRRGIDPKTVDALKSLGLSGIANVLAAIKTAKSLDLPADQMIVTIGTDSSLLYESEREQTETGAFSMGFDDVAAGETYAQHMLGLAADHTLELDHAGRRRIFNLGYYTWVEQQGISLDDFDKRLDPKFWIDVQNSIVEWDHMIEQFNRSTGVNRPG